MTIAVLGAGPHGQEIERLLSARTNEVVVLFDDHVTKYPHLDNVEVGGNEFHWIVGAAWPAVRRHIAEQCDYLMGPYQLGRVYFHGVQIGVDVNLGIHTHVGYNAVLTHGCDLGSFVNVAPGAMLGGDTKVGHDVFIGANATVIHGGITVGDGAFIGAGAVVVDDVPPGVVVAGNPARVVAGSWKHTEMIAGRRGRLDVGTVPA